MKLAAPYFLALAIGVLIGANGAGKSTLMMTIFGNPRAQEGSIVFAGHDITRLPTHDIAKLFATNGLANIIYGKGRVGKGPVHTTCVDSSAVTTCRSWQMACKATAPHTCLGAWLCLPM